MNKQINRYDIKHYIFKLLSFLIDSNSRNSSSLHLM